MSGNVVPSSSAEDAARRATGSIVALGGGEIVSRAVAFAGTAYLARVLGPAAFGVVGFATAVCGYLALAVSAGVTDAGVRAVAARPASAAALAVGVASVRLMVALLALAVLAVVAHVAPIPSLSKTVLFLTGLSFVSLALDTAWAYKGLESGGRVGAAMVLAQALFVGLVLLSVRHPADVVLVPVTQFLAEVTAALWLLVPLARRVQTRPDWRAGWAVVRASGPLALARVLRTVIFSFDVVLLGMWIGSKSVGLYTAAYRVCYLVLAAAVTVHVAYLPGLTRAAAESRPALSALTTRALETALTLGLPAVVGGVVLAGPILVALFGPAYAGGATALRIVLLSIGFILASLAAHNVLLAIGQLWTEVRVIAGAAVLNVTANLWLIPRYGLNGAAVATALAEAVILIGMAVSLRRFGVHPWRLTLARPLTAAAMMGVVLVAWGPRHALAAQIAAGALTYGAGLILLGARWKDRTPTGAPWAGRLADSVQRCLRGGAS